MKRNKILFAIGVCGLSLAACETIPNETRIANYEKSMIDTYVGKSIDNVILALGPPNSSHPLTDGREILQYKNVRIDQSSFGSSFSIGGGFGSYHNRGAVILSWPFFSPFYDNSINTRELVCIRRFLISKDKKVEDFKWEGNSCF